jgi:hypothetical protein
VDEKRKVLGELVEGVDGKERIVNWVGCRWGEGWVCRRRSEGCGAGRWVVGGWSEGAAIGVELGFKWWRAQQ